MPNYSNRFEKDESFYPPLKSYLKRLSRTYGRAGWRVLTERGKKKIVRENEKNAKIACQFTKKPYLCKPIIIREPLKGFSICVLIAFLIGLGKWLVNRRSRKTARR